MKKRHSILFHQTFTLIFIIICRYEGRKHPRMPKEQVQISKLRNKIKKETKSAVREIRRDNAFLSKVKIKEQIASDTERKRKVREIFGDAAMQQHELKKFKKP